MKNWGPEQIIHFFDTQHPRLLKKLTLLLTDIVYSRWGKISVTTESLEQFGMFYEANPQTRRIDNCAMLDGVTLCFLSDLYTICVAPKEKKKRRAITKNLSYLCDVLSKSSDPLIKERKKKLKKIKDIYTSEPENYKYLTKWIPEIQRSGNIPTKKPPDEIAFTLISIACMEYVSTLSCKLQQ